ncbi:pyruvate dehydrogenase (acetyl-transferring) [Trichosporon asahii var. asahii CBS 2479]|uniref:3-methyl-2-oxobutanoate dehydrogenase (2-methylpropanoyl-transferring) n=1 Tax=Trichosporon asahii var. asahii (strain ATCC 90039 / CBS 2479 / JCM 2466 / KCTC 7840 / NBRC 103889/ NCYC 2677 / UAMH 7654) TaxID=1186058 RepID=J6EUL5_TRIAS|nr:pyruvate dehydrogenase (acetyl-transferring) [Trichosporon asahii var. asahii CBS 2479]EJT48284.1 pyruvate dehydrogenase (acetyl-transferring) [Trichosporon asahii var. asahii CBS 2479]
MRASMLSVTRSTARPGLALRPVGGLQRRFQTSLDDPSQARVPRDGVAARSAPSPPSQDVEPSLGSSNLLKSTKEERVFNTPLTEQGIAGFGIGLASVGSTAIAEIQFGDYLVNEAAKQHYASGGSYPLPGGSFTVRAPSMSVGHGGLYHSQSPEGFFLGAAGLKVAVVRSPIQAKGLLLGAIRDPNPTIIFEPKVLYRAAVDDFTLPLGTTDEIRPGTDLTVRVRAIELLTNPPPSLVQYLPEKLRPPHPAPSIQLIDLRTINPLPIGEITDAVRKTGRLVVVHEAGKSGGVGNNLAGEVGRRAFEYLEAPIGLVSGWEHVATLATRFEWMTRFVGLITAAIDVWHSSLSAPMFEPHLDHQHLHDSDRARSEGSSILEELDKLAPIKSFDAFPKVQSSYTIRSRRGGVLTALVGLNDLGEYLYGSTSLSVKVDPTIESNLQLNVDVTVAMPYLSIDLRDGVGDRIHLDKEFAKEGTVFETGKAVTKKVHEGPACRVYGSVQVRKVAANLHITTLGHVYRAREHTDHHSAGHELGDNGRTIIFGLFRQRISMPVAGGCRPHSFPHGGGVPGIFFKYELEPMSITIRERTTTLYQFLIRLVGVQSQEIVAALTPRMSEQQRKLERDRHYADLAAKARLNMTYVTNFGQPSQAAPGKKRAIHDMLTPAMAPPGINDSAHTALAQPQPQSHALYSGDARALLHRSLEVSGRHTDQQADAQFPAGERWDPDPAKHINFLLAEVNKLEKQKDEAVENAKHWHGFSQNANEQHSALERDKAALEQRINSLERQLNEEQASKLALKRRGRSSLTETLDLKEMKELRFHNSALKSQIEELRHETDLELAREVQYLRSNEILQKQLPRALDVARGCWRKGRPPMYASDGIVADTQALLDAAFK